MRCGTSFDVNVFDPFRMEKPRNINTADSTGKDLQTRARSYKANEAFSIRNGKDFLLSACWLDCLWSPLRDCSAGCGNGLASLHSRGVLDEEGHHVLKATAVAYLSPRN